MTNDKKALEVALRKAVAGLEARGIAAVADAYGRILVGNNDVVAVVRPQYVGGPWDSYRSGKITVEIRRILDEGTLNIKVPARTILVTDKNLPKILDEIVRRQALRAEIAAKACAAADKEAAYEARRDALAELATANVKLDVGAAGVGIRIGPVSDEKARDLLKLLGAVL